jgi:hypothetical protein
MYCTPVQYGHSGRGGGVTTVGESCSEAIAGGLAPGRKVRVALTMTEQKAEKLSLGFSASPYPAAAQLDRVAHTTSASVVVVRPPAAVAPIHVKTTESGDQLNVRWRAAAATAPYISASVITATPVGGSSATVLSGYVAGVARKGIVPGVVASTTYSITVANNDGGGAGAISRPVLFKTRRATRRPGAPIITYYWGYVALRWDAPSAGNSVIDRYEVLATGAGQKLTSFVSGSTLSDYLYPQLSDSLTVKVRAHNLAGWGPWSKPVTFTDGGGG